MQSVKVKRPFIVFGQPDISEEEMSAVMDVMRSGWIGTGKICKELENEFVKYMGGGYAVAVSSCTMGLTLALKSLGLSYGDNVLTTPITFCATINAIIQGGGKPVFMDVDDDGNLDKSKLKRSFKRGLDWISPDYFVPVNYCGKPLGWFHGGIPTVEDAAHSFGGSCGYGDITVFSLYATKNITSGEGGIIWTQDPELADRCRILSNHGQSHGAWSRYSSGPIENYKVIHPGFKGNLPDILAAIALVQLKRWPEIKKKRDVVWGIYEKAFGNKGAGHSHHLYTIRVPRRQKVREALYLKGIGTGIHYEALHLQPAYAYLGYKKGDFPKAEKIGDETLSLPISAKMTEDDAHYVVKTVKEVIS